MNAAFCSKYGSPDFISVRETDTPLPQRDEILVRVCAATVNRSDVAILNGSLLMRLFTGLSSPRRTITGTDFAGEVVETGPGVTSFKPGDRIFGFHDMGLASHAEYMIVNKRIAVGHIPAGISFETAAASLEAAHYAINFINKVPIKAGDAVMVNGGTGGIGSALIQLLRVIGAKITATCRPEHMDLVLRLGADRVIDYTNTDFTDDKGTYDYVFDAVGKSSFARCKRLLTRNGVYSSSELGEWAANPFLALVTPLRPGPKVVFPVPVRLSESISRISTLLSAAHFNPLIDRTYPLEKITDAFRYVASGQKVGNVVLKINS